MKWTRQDGSNYVDPDYETSEELIHVRDALIAAGIEIEIGGCGCCGSPWAALRLPNGEAASIDNVRLSSFIKE